MFKRASIENHNCFLHFTSQLITFYVRKLFMDTTNLKLNRLIMFFFFKIEEQNVFDIL